MIRAQQQQQVVHGVAGHDLRGVQPLGKTQVKHVVVEPAYCLLQLPLAEVIAAKCTAKAILKKVTATMNCQW